MKNKILIGGAHIEYEVRKSRRSKRLKLSVYRDGRIAVSGPVGLSESLIEGFLREKAAWILEKVEDAKARGGKIGLLAKRDKSDFRLNKLKARKLILERIAYFNKNYGFKYGRVSVRDQRTRWGSCSKDGNLNFSYKLVHLPSHLADYIIVHELCHLKEFNHSKGFWDLVSKTFPDYKEIRKQLKVE